MFVSGDLCDDYVVFWRMNVHKFLVIFIFVLMIFVFDLVKRRERRKLCL
ncbi:hypothetical protein MtrunA17_Chr3g0078441 [Medicago truncatula]|uniref:Transmembrane protein n=1 Tax=Medicago truncatula TaxID=3880 RepID=A0A396IKY5_MEDTR|nr:hypothetical protein MtrunA17_Chr3g0078441 [Medicago truncatula]